jgi:hypothetical protein
MPHLELVVVAASSGNTLYEVWLGDKFDRFAKNYALLTSFLSNRKAALVSYG